MGLFDNKKRPNGLLGNVSEEGLLALANALYQQGQPSLTPKGGLNLAAPMLAYKQASKGNETDRFYLQLGIDPKDPLREEKAKRAQGLSGTPMYQNFLFAQSEGYPFDFNRYVSDVNNKTLALNTGVPQTNQVSNTEITQPSQEGKIDSQVDSSITNPRIYVPTDRALSQPTADGRINVLRNGELKTVFFEGSKAYDDEIRKFELRRIEEIKKLQPVFNNAVRIKEIVTENPQAVGAFSALTESLRGSDARTVQELLEPIKAYTGFATLAAIKASSPKGGALGQVSNQEISLLQNAWGSLSNSLNAQDFVKQLDIVVKQAEQSLANLEREAQTKGVPIEADPVAKALQDELNSFLNTYKTGVGGTSTLKPIDEMTPEEIDAELNS
tara:strand:+ start:15297 stop:16451 length:1155 start_codon:yes stop_codon:yes gene_type:complete